MLNKISRTSRMVTLRVQPVLRRASLNVSLVARMAAVIAVGILGVNLLNDITPSFAMGGSADVTALVADLLRAQAQVSMKLMALGRDVFAFVWGP